VAKPEIVINAKGDTAEVSGSTPPEFFDKKINPKSYDSYLEQMVNEQRMRREYDPSQNEATIQIQTHLPWIGLFMTGDWHLGSERTDYTGWQRDQNTVMETEGLYECIVGDERDNFVIPKYATGRDEHLINPQQQAEFIEWHLKTMDNAGKIIARCGGNHDGWTWMMSGIHLENFWYRSMKSPLLENGGFVHLSANDAKYDVFLHHGLSRFNSSFNPNHATKRAFEFQGPFDIGAMGHVHVAETAHGYRWSDQYQKDYVQMRTGTYKLDDQWARSMNMGRGQPAGSTVLISTEEKRMLPFLKLKDAVMVLDALNGKGIAQGILGMAE
jgi:hypothetical protein